MKENAFQDDVVFGLVLHVQLNAAKDLEKALDELEGVEVIYEKTSDDKLYVTSRKPEPKSEGEKNGSRKG